MRNGIFIMILFMLLSGCTARGASDGVPFTTGESRSINTTQKTDNMMVFKIRNNIPCDLEHRWDNGELLSAIRFTDVSYKDAENYLTKNRDVEVTIINEVLYKNYMDYAVFSLDLTDENGGKSFISKCKSVFKKR